MEDINLRKGALQNTIDSYKRKIEPLEKELIELEKTEEKLTKKKTIKESV